ncbi:hypothetical protein V7024_15940 [Bacillus sp. JJ864]|uniref:hypothetical protein n=1 Tax=Bacillus sp. JJ864 TaxID=3122975 RepID=UPI002FFE57D1
MREIFLPICLNYETAIEFSNKLKSIDLINNKDLVIIDITNFSKANGKVEPFGALMVINSIRSLKRKCGLHDVPIKIRYTKEYGIKNTYARSLRFYSSLGLDIGEPPETDYVVSSSARFIPIIKSDFSDISNAIHEQDEINLISKRIAKVISRGNENLYEYMEFSINEILRNVIEHSGKREIWYCAQYWPTTVGGKLIEVAIMDEGIGIQNSLIEELGDEEENVLKFALVPGCSSKPTTHYIDSAPNSGFGLYMTSEIGRDTGDFILASNTDVLYASGKMERSLECFVTGTIITLRLYIDSLQDYKVKNEELVSKGLEKAQEYLRYREGKKFAPGLEMGSFFK